MTSIQEVHKCQMHKLQASSLYLMYSPFEKRSEKPNNNTTMTLAIGVSLSILHVGPSSVLTLLYEIVAQGVASELLPFLQFSINEHNWPTNSQHIGLQPYLL